MPESSTPGTEHSPDTYWDDQAGHRGQSFIRAMAERFLLSEWIGDDWHRAAYDLGTTPKAALPGIKRLAHRIQTSFTHNLTHASWLDVDEPWHEYVRRDHGAAKPGVNEGNVFVNMEAELIARYNRWAECLHDEDAKTHGMGFRMGVLMPLLGMQNQADLKIQGDCNREAIIHAQALVEIWHECYGRAYDPGFFKPKVDDDASVGMRVGIIHILRLIAPGLTIQDGVIERDSFDQWMRTTVQPWYRGFYQELTGHALESFKHYVWLQNPLNPRPLRSLTKGKGAKPETSYQMLGEAFLGLPIQVLHPPHDQYLFNSAGLMIPLLKGLAISEEFEDRVRILQIRHDDEGDSVALLLPTVLAFNQGLGGWLLFPDYWSGRGSIEPSRQLRFERLVGSFPHRFEFDTIDAPLDTLVKFLRKAEHVGTPEWLHPTSVRDHALDLERNRVLPSAQSLVLELLAGQYADQNLDCTSTENSMEIDGLELDVVGMNGGTIHHLECENTAVSSKIGPLLEEFALKRSLLEQQHANHEIQQYYVTRQASLDALPRKDFVTKLEAEGIKLLTFERDLMPLFPKGAGRNRLHTLFPSVEEDPVLKAQKELHAVLESQGLAASWLDSWEEE